MNKKKRAPIGVFQVEPFGVQVAVFDSYERASEYYLKDLGIALSNSLGPANGAYIAAEDDEGLIYYSIIIPKHATKYTRIHECSHIVDLIFDDLGIPLSADNTETKAYTLAYICELLDAILETEK